MPNNHQSLNDCHINNHKKSWDNFKPKSQSVKLSDLAIPPASYTSNKTIIPRRPTVIIIENLMCVCSWKLTTADNNSNPKRVR